MKKSGPLFFTGGPRRNVPGPGTFFSGSVGFAIRPQRVLAFAMRQYLVFSDYKSLYSLRSDCKSDRAAASLPVQPNCLPVQPNSLPVQPNCLPVQPKYRSRACRVRACVRLVLLVRLFRADFRGGSGCALGRYDRMKQKRNIVRHAEKRRKQIEKSI